MNTENGNVNGAVAIQPQIEMFGGLFKADGELAGVLGRKKSKSGSMRVRRGSHGSMQLLGRPV
jgi:hypothetical protein